MKHLHQIRDATVWLTLKAADRISAAFVIHYSGSDFSPSVCQGYLFEDQLSKMGVTLLRQVLAIEL
jgi:hypothetical protein